jgi:predicted hotdog family 3-hydroxylacyl-ACP dehydratase
VQKKEMKEAGIEKMNILELIPQRAPFVMVDGLTEIGPRSAISVFRVTEDNILVKDGLLQESGIMENIAQTAAAMQGYRMRAGGGEIKQGYIGGIKNLVICSLPAVGDRLTTVVLEMHDVLNAVILQGEVMIGEQKIASCEMKVFIPDQ